MAVVTRNMLPVVEARRRPTHREITRGAGLAHRPPPAPGRMLALVALATLRRARREEVPPARWDVPAFAREVDLVRLHLAPIRSRLGLAASFGREAFQANFAHDSNIASPVSAAYAIRWLELGDRIARPPWQAWLAEGGDRTRPRPKG